MIFYLKRCIIIKISYHNNKQKWKKLYCLNSQKVLIQLKNLVSKIINKIIFAKFFNFYQECAC